MALKAYQKATLGIRIVAASCCEIEAHDLTGASADDDVCDAMRGSLQSWIGSAKLAVKKDGDVVRHLNDAAGALNQLAGTLPDAAARFGAAVDLLRSFAKGVLPGNGDGPALNAADGDNLAPDATRCTCGFLNVAGEVERRARLAYFHANALRHGFPVVHYETAVVKDAAKALAPFRLIGDVDISSAPRLVKLRIKDSDLRARDICQIAYVFFH